MVEPKEDKVVSEKKVTLAIQADRNGRAFHYLSAGAVYETYLKKGETAAKAQTRADKHTLTVVVQEVEKLVRKFQ